MEFKTVLFWVFSAMLIAAALRVITARNPVHAALFLVLSFFSAAALWMLLKAEFLSIVLILVYVGAVMVLFLFVVMMLDINLEKIRAGFWGYFPLAASVGVVIVLEMSAVIFRGFWAPDMAIPAASDKIGSTGALGKLLYTEYVYAFEIAGAILLVAIISAVALALRRRKDSKYFDPADAVKVQAKDRVRLVSMVADPSRAAERAASSTPSSKDRTLP